MLFDPIKLAYYIEKVINSYITYMLKYYHMIYRHYTRQDLWQIFYKDFKGFTFDLFRKGYQVVVREL